MDKREDGLQAREDEDAELLLAEAFDMLARGVRQTRHGEEPRAWRPDELFPSMH